MRGILDRGENIFALKERVIAQNLVSGCAVSEKLQDIRNAEAMATDTGATTTFAGFDGDSLESLRAHNLRIHAWGGAGAGEMEGMVNAVGIEPTTY